MKVRKLTKTQFKEAFKRGLGNSYIELKESNNREKYKDIVLWSCLHNTCYDMQCEGGRGIFLYDAICLFEDRSFFEEAIIQKFMQKNLDTWLFDQLCELLYLFSVDGSVRARESLYEKYNTLFGFLSHRANRLERDNFEWLCVWLTSLDGFPAFKSIVKQLGEYLLRNRDVLNMDWFYSNAKNKFGDKRVDTFLQNNAIKFDYVKAFLNSVSRTTIQNRQSIDSPTLEELIEASREKRSRGLALRFAKIASEDDLIKLARYSMEETNFEIKLELLWTFRKVRFPLDEQFIFELAESDNQSIRDVAFEIMRHLPSDRIHDFAINLLKQKKELANALTLLCYCYKSEDETVLLEGIQSLTVSYDEGEWHGVFMSVEDLLDKRSVKINPSVYIYMYRQTLCSYCRHTLIQGMSKRKVLPQEILEECLYDSYEDTRKFALRKLKKLR
ncbi:hypothetical protein [Paenibacillus sp. OAS669]|uniref:hypothetical protein n=1 Tax=Paenibacillus sp. OAS669 TaxID=2663821 RepID=UPI00178B0657|nr:hypothetical protein [Paenibacillus sp. OAS669]MBE1446166.1 hypothetical protein [Paenibacillus sp. OAS669]